MSDLEPGGDGGMWIRSSFCSSGACILARRTPDGAQVRTDRVANSPVLTFSPARWADLLAVVLDADVAAFRSTPMPDGDGGQLLCLVDSHARHLHVTADEVEAFVAGVRAGEFDLERLAKVGS